MARFGKRAGPARKGRCPNLSSASVDALCGPVAGPVSPVPALPGVSPHRMR